MADIDFAEPTRIDHSRVTLTFRPTEEGPFPREQDSPTAFW